MRLFILYVIFSALTINAQNTNAPEKTYIGLNSTIGIDPDSIKHLIIDCNKLDSINKRILKFRNLRVLEFISCTYSSAFRNNILNEKEKARFLKHKERDDEYNNTRKPDIKYKEMPIYSDWDSIYFENQLYWVSPELYQLKNLEFLFISGKISYQAKRFLKNYRRRTRVKIYVSNGVEFK